MYKTTTCLSLFCCILLASCNYTPNTQKKGFNPKDAAIGNLLKSEEEIQKEEIKRQPKTLFTGTKTKEREDGSLHTSITYKEGVQHGPAIEYYQNGTIAKQVQYVDGKLQGVASTFDQHGRLMKTMHYTDGKKNGKVTQYFKSGKPKSELTYNMDTPLNDLWEKDARGNVKKDFGDIVFEMEKISTAKNIFTLHMSLKPKVYKFACYAFPADINYADGIKKENLISKNVASHGLKLEVPVGERLQGAIRAVAIYDTPMGNEAVVYGEYQVDIKN